MGISSRDATAECPPRTVPAADLGRTPHRRIVPPIVFTTLAVCLTASIATAQPADGPAQPAGDSTRPPNVLFISTDDLNHDLPCYGVPEVHTPNLDRLVRDAVVFERAYCQYPQCSQSRSSMLTGLRPDTIRVYDLKTHFREQVPDAVTLPQLFRRNDYFVARAGKIYHYGNPGDIGTDGLDDDPSWDRVVNPAGRDKAEEHLITNATARRGLGSSISWLAAEGTDEEQTDGLVTTSIISLMEANRDRPFFLAAGFYRPHSPYVAPKKYFDLYPLDEITLPEIDPDDYADVPPIALASVKPWPWFGINRDEARRGKQAYYATVSFVDAQVGRLLDALDRLGLTENTIVVFWSDHGYFLGEKGLWKKQSNFERVARAPMIVRAPGLTTGGNSPRPVEFVDLYPTLADLCGLTPPEDLAGVSLRTLLDEPESPWDRPAFTQVRRGRNVFGYSIRTQRWRYTEWGRDGSEGVELYDHENDPHEESNLAQSPEHAEVVARLRDQLRPISDRQPQNR